MVRATSYDKAATTTTRRDDGRAEGRKGRRTEGQKDRRTEGQKDGRMEGRKDRRTEEPGAFPSHRLAPPHRRSSETQTAASSFVGAKPRLLDLWKEQQLAMKWRDDNNEKGQHAAQSARSTNMEAVPIANPPRPPPSSPPTSPSYRLLTSPDSFFVHA